MEKKFSVVRAITDCYHMSDDDKLTLIKSYLLGWTDEETALRVVKANNRLTAADLVAYKKARGARAAANLLLLAGPDGYSGFDDYDALMDELEAEAEREEGGYNHDPA